MGLLDDAIREHLDLKRRRGADPSEVARLEQEALGPVRRERASAGDADEHHHDEPAHADEPPAREPHEHPHPAAEGIHPDDRTHVLAPEDRHDPPHGDPLFEQYAENVELGGAAAPHPEPPAPEPAPEPAPAAERHPEPAPAREHEPQEPHDPRRSDIVDQPTTEYRVEDHHDDEDDEDGGDEHDAPDAARHAHDAEAGAGPDEDVLEETPEFLQETPEHDRLWFEQRPPRDFDFDG